MDAKSIFEKAVLIPKSELSNFLDDQCGKISVLRAEVENLMRSANFCSSPPSLSTICIPDASSKQDDSISLKGVVIAGRYVLQKKLGEGGMGEVWMADQSTPVRRQVAVKLIKKGLVSRDYLVRFEGERQALALMNHPNIASILDAGTTTTGQPFYAMEMVAGVPLTEYCDSHRLGINQRLELFSEICNGVQHAHQKGIIHRDLKPSNIVVGENDGNHVAKIIDFGLAKALDQSMQLHDESFTTEIGQVLGTYRYMAPEQASLDGLDVDTRADIYAMGVILYELLTGTTPFDDLRIKGMSRMHLLELIREKDPVKPSSRLSSKSPVEQSSITSLRRTDSTRLKRILSGDLDWIVMKALEKDRSRRYENASGLAMDIRRYLDGEPVYARPPALNYRLRKFLRKNKLPVIAGSLFLISLLVGIIGTTFGMLRAFQAESVAEQRLEETELARIQETMQREIAETARKEAEKNLEFSKKTNEILGSIFTSLDPTGQYQTIAELRNVLQENLISAANELQGSSVGDPLTVAEMQVILGKSMLGLGNASAAHELFCRAYAVQTDLLGVDHSKTLTSAANQAIALKELGSIKDSLRMLENTLSIEEEKFGKNHPGSLNTMINLGAVYQSDGQMSKAEEILTQAFQVSKLHFGAENDTTLIIMNNLASVHDSVGNVLEAIATFKEILEIKSIKLGLRNADLIATKNNLAAAYHANGQLDLALQLFVEVNEFQTNSLGSDHPRSLASANNVASTYYAMGKTELALPMLERIFDVQKNKLGVDHPDTLLTMSSLAAVYQSQGLMEEALELYEMSTELIKNKLGPEHPEALININFLGFVYAGMDQMEKAVSLHEEAASGMEKIGFQHQFAKSIVFYTATAYDKIGDFFKADEWRTKWLNFTSQRFGDDSIDFANELASFGVLLLKRNKFPEAEEAIRKSLTIRENNQIEDWVTHHLRSVLGEILTSQKKYDEAQLILIDAYDGLRVSKDDIPPESLKSFFQALERLIVLYEVLDRPSDVAKFRDLLKAEMSNLETDVFE